MNKVIYFFGAVFILFGISCKEEALPKPKAMLSLEYPTADTKLISTSNFDFQSNTQAHLKFDNEQSVTIDYPNMKGAIFLTYKTIDHNLEKLLSDAQKFSYEHAVKADDILEQPFLNNEDKVFGMFYEVKGDAASQSQFYVTDSVHHFVTGSLYFYAKPNYDSILPAAVYLQKDIRRIMETLRWK